MSYPEAILYIETIFPDNDHVGFDPLCICAKKSTYENGIETGFKTVYNKICVEFSGKKIYWPILQYED